MEAEVHLVCSDILSDIGKVRCLERIEEYEEREDLVICRPLCRKKLMIVLQVLIEVDLLRNPEVVHRLTVPVACPGVFEVVEIIQIRSVSSDHAPFKHIGISIGVEQRFCFQFIHYLSPYLR